MTQFLAVFLFSLAEKEKSSVVEKIFNFSSGTRKIEKHQNFKVNDFYSFFHIKRFTFLRICLKLFREIQFQLRVVSLPTLFQFLFLCFLSVHMFLPSGFLPLQEIFKIHFVIEKNSRFWPPKLK